MSTTDNIVFKSLHVIAWIIFVGLCIEAGALIVNFIVSIYRPELIKNLYLKLDISEVYTQDKWVFFGIYSFSISLALLKASLFYMVIVLLSKMDLMKPFNSFVSRQITNISYYTFSIGIIGYIARQVVKSLQHQGYKINSLDEFGVDSQAFILMAAVIYVIATIFKKGVDIQTENDLTV